MIDSKTFCIMPFIHQNIKQEGKVSACWRYPDRLGDYRNQSLEEIWNSDETKKLREDLLNDREPDGCRSCWDFERSGVTSTRQKCNENYEKKFEIDRASVLSNLREDYSMPYRPRSIEIRFDNTCNLRCRHCSPTYSSQWEALAFKNQEVKDLFKKYGAGRLEQKHISLPQERFDDFKKTVPYLKEILIAGGEALQQKRHWEMIEFIRPYAANITLSYNSNLVDLGIGKWSVLEEWPRFKKIILRVSLDGDDKIYDYFRTNGDLNRVKSNIERLYGLSNIDLSLTITVSIYNISRLVDCAKYVTKLGGLFHTSLVQYPRPINPKVLPQDIKSMITAKWRDFRKQVETMDIWQHKNWNNRSLIKEQLKRFETFGDSVIDYMNAEDYSGTLPETKDYIELLDRVNDTRFESVYPELAMLTR